MYAIVHNLLKHKYKKSFFLFVMVCLVGGCSLLNRRLGLDDDNVIEEFIEDEIWSKTSLDIDLTPFSPEQ